MHKINRNKDRYCTTDIFLGAQITQEDRFIIDELIKTRATLMSEANETEVSRGHRDRPSRQTSFVDIVLQKLWRSYLGTVLGSHSHDIV